MEMDFFTMKRKKLQSLCKKHGIPANLKNIEMAGKLSLLYKEKENERPVSRRLRTKIDKLNVEIIILDSDSDTDVQMEAPGTAGGNADVSEVKSASSQKTSKGQEESQMELEGEKSEDNVRSVYLEENKQMSVIKDKIEDNQELQATPTDPNVHHIVDSGTAAGHVDACQVMSESLQTTSQVREESEMKLTPERSDNVATFYTEEILQMSINVLDQFGNMMVGENSYGTPIQFLPTSDLNIHKMVVKDTCEEGMLKLSEKTSMVAGLEEHVGFSLNELEASTTKGSEAGTDFDQTTHRDVMESYNRRNNQEDCASDQGEVEKDCKEKIDVAAEHFLDEVHSSGLKYLVGEPDQFVVTSPLSEMKFSDVKIHRMVDSGTAGGNADVSEVKSASSQQMSRGQDKSQMKLQGEKSEDNVRSVYLEENKQMSVIKDKIEDNHMVDSGTAAGHVNACEVMSESLQTTSQGREDSEMKLTPERSDNAATFYTDEIMQMSINVLDQFGNMMVGENSYGTPIQYLPTSDLNIHKMVVKDTCEEGMLKLSEKTSMVADLEERIGFFPNEFEASTTKGSEAETYFDQTTHGDVMETYNRKESMQFDKMEKQNNQEDCISAQGEISKCFDNSDVAEKDRKKTDVAVEHFVDEAHSSGLKYSVGEPDEFLATSSPSEMKLSDLNIHDMVDSGTAGVNADVCEVKSASSQQMSKSHEESKMKLPHEISDDNAVSFNLEENKQMSGNKEQIEDNHMVDSDTVAKTNVVTDQFLTTSPLSEVKSSDLNFHHMFQDNTDVGGVGVEDENDSYKESTKRKRSDDVVDTNSVEEVKAGELVPTVSQPSEMMLCNFSLQQLFATDTCEEEMLNLSEKEKTCMVADLAACIEFPPNDLEAATTKGSEADTDFDPTTVQNVVTETCDTEESIQTDKMEKENNEEDCISAQREVSKSFDNSDVGENELVQTVSQPSEMESFNFSLQQLCASDTASGDEDGYQKKLDTPSKATPTASGEKNIGFSPKLHESKMTFQCERSSDNAGSFYFEENQQMSVNKEQTEDNKEFSPAPNEENLDLHPAALSENVNVLEEFGKHMMVGEDSDGRPVDFLPTSDFEASATKSEAETYFDQGTIGDVMETYNVKESMQIDMLEKETNQEDCISAQGEVSKFLDNSDVYDDISGVGAEGENQSHRTSRKRKSRDEDDTSANSDVKSDELVPTVTQSSEMESCDFSLQQSFASGELVPTVSQASEMMLCNFSLQQLFATDTCEEEMLNLSEKEKTSMVADLATCIEFPPNDLEAATTKGSEAETYFDPTIVENAVMETCNMEERIQTDKMEKENNEADCISAQREVSKPFDNSDVGADELVHTVPQPSELESCDFSLQHLFSSDTASGDEDAYQKKLDTPSKATPTASGEKNMVFSPKLHESKMTFQCERSRDNVGSFYYKETKQISVHKEQIVDNNELSPSPSEENLELHQAAPIEDVNVLEEFGKCMMVQDDSDGRPVQFLLTSDLEASATKGSEAETYNVKESMQEDGISAQGEVSKFVENADVYDDIDDVGTEGENQPHITTRKRKSSDENDTRENSDEDVKADELVPTVPQSSEMESCDFSLQQLFASDTASGDEDAYSKKLVTPSKAKPTASGEKNMIFSAKLHESKMTFQCERSSNNIGSFFFEENQQMSVNKEQTDDNKEFSPAPSEENLELHPAAPSENVNVLEEFGKHMMVGEDSDGRPVDFLPTSDFEASATKASEAETYFDQGTIGDVMETYNVKESMQIDVLEKETNQEDCISAQREVCKFLDNSDVYDDISGVGAEGENQTHMMSRKRKSSDVKADVLVPTVTQPSEMELCDFSLEQLFASGTAFGDEEAYKTKLDSPLKATPVASGEKNMIFSPKLKTSLPQKCERDNSIEMSLPQKRERGNSIEMSLPQKRERDSNFGTRDMKENINIDKKEEVGSMMSKTKFAKRQPLHDLQQN